MAKIKENNKKEFLHPDFPGEITGEMVIKENQTHRDDIMNGMDLCSAILYHHAKKHDLDKNVPENAEVLAKAINTGDFTDWNEIHCYKHNGNLHRQWDEAVLLDVKDDYMVFGNNKTLVVDSDGKVWRTKEPAIMFFFKENLSN